MKTRNVIPIKGSVPFLNVAYHTFETPELLQKQSRLN
mgnify:CR=1 FL=1